MVKVSQSLVSIQFRDSHISPVFVKFRMAEFEIKCNTCKAAFKSTDEIKEHYRDNWHVFNSKRRANQLAPVTLKDFKMLGAKPAPVKAPSPGKLTYVPVKREEDPRFVKTVKSGSEVVPTDITPPAVKSAENNNEDEEDEEETEVEAPPLGLNISIFDNKVFDSQEECVEYMSLTYGFFIPDIEYLTDMPGFLTYLGEKVKLGGYCLYCQKKFGTYRSCQNHMISKSHCKIAYEEGVDADEFEDFYDFSSTFEDCDSDEEEGAEMEISNTGELILPDGRTLGHRQFRVYYKQHYRPEEDRPSVLAVQREELLRLGYQFGGQAAVKSREDMLALTDTQVMTMLVKLQKDIRRGQVVEQRAMMKKNNKDQRREYKNNVNKLRSSETTTAKIRDYHGMLM